MRDWSRSTTTLFLAFCLGTSCFCVYLTYLPINHTYDGMVFASLIEQKEVPFWELFHPHHLLYNFLGRMIFLWGHFHGADWDGLEALQFFDVLTGVLGVIVAFHLLVRLTEDRCMAFLSSLGLAFTYSYWYFSTSPGVRIFATVTPLLVWYVSSYLKNSPPIYGFFLGVAHTLAVLGHQTNLLLVPAFLGGVWYLKGKSVQEKLWMSFFYIFTLTIGVLGIYAFVGRYLCERTTYSSWVWWIMSYMHVKEWGGHLGPAGFEKGRFAMVFAFLAGSYPTKPLGQYLTFGMARSIFQDAILVVLGALLINIRYFWLKYSQTIWIGLFWLLAFVPFFIWWEPWNIEFWVSSTVPCWILMGLVASDISRHFTNPVLRLSNRLLFLLLWASLISLLFLYNFEGRVKNNSTTYANKELLAVLDWKTKPHDLLLLTGLNTIPFYIDRYEHRSYLSLYKFFQKYKSSKKEEMDFPIDPWKDLDSQFRDTWKNQGKVWILTEVVDPNSNWTSMLEQLEKFPDGSLRDFFNQYDLAPVSYHDKVYLYEIRPKNVKNSSGAKVHSFITPPQDSIRR
jgi:hypothetical protein